MHGLILSSGAGLGNIHADMWSALCMTVLMS